MYLKQGRALLVLAETKRNVARWPRDCAIVDSEGVLWVRHQTKPQDPANISSSHDHSNTKTPTFSALQTATHVTAIAAIDQTEAVVVAVAHTQPTPALTPTPTFSHRCR